MGTITTTTTTVTTTTSTTTTITTTTNLITSTTTTPATNSTAVTMSKDCIMENAVPVMKTLEVIENIDEARECMELCLASPGCDFYKWKQAKTQKQNLCSLLKVVMVTRSGLPPAPDTAGQNCRT